MHFYPPLIEGRLIKRYKRFFADILLLDGTTITAHCPNTGSMMGLLEEGHRVGISHHVDPKRKLAYTLEMIEEDGVMVGVNTQTPNKLAHAAFQAGFFEGLRDYSTIHREVKINATSRIDFALTGENLPTAYVEVKNVHFKKGATAYFPDAVTTRGQKHLRELIHLQTRGNRCIMLYIIQRDDVENFAFADFIDPDYAHLGKEAYNAGVTMIAAVAKVDLTGIMLTRSFPVRF